MPFVLLAVTRERAPGKLGLILGPTVTTTPRVSGLPVCNTRRVIMQRPTNSPHIRRLLRVYNSTRQVQRCSAD